MSNYVEHAKREFLSLGYKPIDKCEDDPDKWIQENVLELLEVFDKQGHSGHSAPFAIKYFSKLANFKPLGPIQCTEEEWAENLGTNDDGYQNKRCGALFKKGKNGRPYYLNAIVWRNEKGLTYTGSALDKKGNTVRSRQFVKDIPFTPKTFYLDIIEEEVKKDDWIFHIKYEEQLNEVYEHYDKRYQALQQI